MWGRCAVTAEHDEARVVETLLDLRCEAVLLLSSELSEVVLAAVAARVPLVSVGRHVEPAGFDVVRVADEDGVAEAVDHLVALGHRDLVHVDGGSAAMAAHRRAGFRAAVTRHGLREARVVAGGYTEADGARAADALLAVPRLQTAVLAANDRNAIGLMDVFLQTVRPVLTADRSAPHAD